MRVDVLDAWLNCWLLMCVVKLYIVRRLAPGDHSVLEMALEHKLKKYKSQLTANIPVCYNYC